MSGFIVQEQSSVKIVSCQSSTIGLIDGMWYIIFILVAVKCIQYTGFIIDWKGIFVLVLLTLVFYFPKIAFFSYMPLPQAMTKAPYNSSKLASSSRSTIRPIHTEAQESNITKEQSTFANN